MIIKEYINICKPKVIVLMIITSWIGMLLASPNIIDIKLFIFGSIGIIFCSSSGAAINHLLDREIDKNMARTKNRPIVKGKLKPIQAIIFASILSFLGILLLILFVNTTCAILNFISLFGYGFIYTIYLKHNTPQNIVIGGLYGAMPPLLGWSAISGDINPYAILLVLIIFTWTPPHFWALSIYRFDDYKKVNIPMLPVIHGIKFTKICIILYVILLKITALLLYATGMAGGIYLLSSLILGFWFLIESIKLYRSNDKIQGKITFKFSILYLFLLFIFLLFDQYFWLII
jgi:protoheme IX farnesyltransferase